MNHTCIPGAGTSNNGFWGRFRSPKHSADKAHWIANKMIDCADCHWTNYECKDCLHPMVKKYEMRGHHSITIYGDCAKLNKNNDCPYFTHWLAGGCDY